MRRIHLLAILIALAGCHGSEERDSHTEVFKTPQQAVGARQARLLQSHKELAISVLRFARPDIEATAGSNAEIMMRADGVNHTIDLSPIEKDLTRNANDERAIMRRYLETQLRPFDEKRLKALGFDRAKQLVGFELLDRRRLEELQQTTGDAPLRVAPVATNLYRVTVVRRANPAVVAPVTAALADAWHVSPVEVDAIAMQNLRQQLSSASESLFETVNYGPLGRSGELKPQVDVAVILLPEFLAAVQKAWKSTDDLVLCVPGSAGASFVESKNTKLLDVIAPRWKRVLASTPDALCNQLLLRDAQTLTLFAYTPTTTPATGAATRPATKPAPYIVR